jgi:hypothetical protein
MSNIYYSGHQWTVTDYGIESRDGWYDIHHSDFTKDVGEGGWPGHMAGKDWVDIEDFKRAFSVACRVHK